MILLCLASDNYVRKYSVCIASQEQYCKKHGYTYKLITGKKEERNWKRAKVDEVCKFLADDDVCLIDADCLIKDNCPQTETFISDKSIYYAVGKSKRLNSGFLYFKKDKKSKKFIKDLKNKLSYEVPNNSGYFVTKEGENGHIIWLKAEYEQKNIDIFQEIPKLWNCSSPALMDDAYILHFTNNLKNELEKFQ